MNPSEPLSSMPSFRSAPAPVIRGVCSAVLVPRRSSGDLDLHAFASLIDFLQARGITSFAVNGATGEYARSSLEEVRRLVQVVRRCLGPDGSLVVGIGAADRARTQELSAMSEGEGAHAVLLPVPYYFPISQGDIMAFVEGLDLRLPTYLYNLPSFTSALEPETVLSLCQTCPNVVGVKDSSGSLDTVRLLSRQAPSTSRIIGNDGALYGALTEDLCHGVVSGVSGVLPELMLALYNATLAGPRSDRARSLQATLTDLIARLEMFPVPWGLKILAEKRALFPAEFSLPLSTARAAEKDRFRDWIDTQRERLLIS